MSEIRIGEVSSINYENGMISVVYPDKNNVVTGEMPYLCNGEYKMPELGQTVLVGHLTTGNEGSVCIGTFWNKANKPAQNGKETYKKELTKGCAIRSSEGSMIFSTKKGSISVDSLLSMYDRIGELENRTSEQKRNINQLKEKVAELGG